jgi:hypothetical protein
VRATKWAHTFHEEAANRTPIPRPIKGLDTGAQTLDIARGVLIDGKPQKEFATALALSRGAISQAVNRVWAAHEEMNLPQGYVRVSAILPEHRAFIVRKWAEDARKKRQHKK